MMGGEVMGIGHTTRKKEVAIAATIAIVDTVVVAALNFSGALYTIPAAFAAGVGTGAVVVYVILTNMTTRQQKRSSACANLVTS